MSQEMNMRDYLGLIKKRWYWMLLVTVAVTALIGGPALLKKEFYEAKATLLLKDTGDRLQSLSPPATLFGQNSSPNSFLNIISSRVVAEMVLDELDLYHKIKGWDAPQVKKQELVTAVQQMFKPSNQGQLLEFKVINNDPRLAKEIVDGYVAESQAYWNKMNYTEARKKKEYLESQLPRLKSEIASVRSILKNYLLLMADPLAEQNFEIDKYKKEYAILNESYTLLRKEYEIAKLDEAKELEPVMVLDPAEVPLKPIKAKVFYDFVIGLLAGGFCSLFLAFFLEYWEKTASAKR